MLTDLASRTVLVFWNPAGQLTHAVPLQWRSFWRSGELPDDQAAIVPLTLLLRSSLY